MKPLLFCFIWQLAATGAEVFNSHEVRLDASGKLVSWVQPQEKAYDHVIRLAWDFLLEKVPVEKNGLKTYYAYCCIDPQKVEGTSWPHNPAGFNAMLADSAAAYYAYSGDRRVVDLARGLLDYQILHGTTPSAWLWGNLPYASSDNGSTEYRGAYETHYDDKKLGRGDGYGVVEPDKAGELGVGYLKFYELTGDVIYRDAALAIGRTLAKNVREGSDTESPWPFRVYAETGVVREEYTSHVIAPVRLFDELLRLHLGDAAEFGRARSLAWAWLMRYPMRNSLWVNYFEDIPIMKKLDNLNQYAPMETARYLMQNQESDPEWKAHVSGLIEFVEKEFAVDIENGRGQQWGANAISEQKDYMPKMGSHTSRYASVVARWAELTGDAPAKEKAFRSLNWATYMCRPNGMVNDQPRVAHAGIWFSDGYGDFIRHFLAAMGAVPEWAPSGEDHLLRSSSIIDRITYVARNIRYHVFDSGSSETLRLSFIPARVMAGGTALTKRSDLEADGWTWDAKLNVLRVRHAAQDVEIGE
jgi:hypothetical protein